MQTQLTSIVLSIAGLSLVLLWVLWSTRIGWRRASVAALCRAGWSAPIFLAFFPVATSYELPRALRLKPLHILVDDSQSMDSPTFKRAVESTLNTVVEECELAGCAPHVAYLSAEDSLTKQGYTPLSRALPMWMYRVNQFPWMVLTDGGDFRPSLPWPAELAEAGRQHVDGLAGNDPASSSRGIVVGFVDDSEVNVWLEDADIAPFSFEGKPLFASVYLRRGGDRGEALRVQVQVEGEGTTLATANAFFEAGEASAEVTLPIPALPRGSHLLSVRALATPNERVLWDNSGYWNVEVLANTVGVLHLLGSPSWDGRFLRRFLKAEPKFDLISFFILRDPWDSQKVNERELSLIPFPVARLFNEELPNFRVIILQDFTLLQFLLPEYQSNLVKFVKDGGGLLFVGGPRALLNMDIQNSPLREILPFVMKDGAATSTIFTPLMGDLNRGGVDKSGPWFEPDRRFSVQMAKPDSHRRALANVYDEWEVLGSSLTSFKEGRGLHHLENVKFKSQDVYTPLLMAETDDGLSVPLAVASSPGKGRAIWIFTDSLWRLALTPQADTPREVYHRLMQGAMTWLLRQELKQPVVVRNLHIRARPNGGLTWQVDLQGAAVRYFDMKRNWLLTVCGVQVNSPEVFVSKMTEDHWQLRGHLDLEMVGGQRCRLNLRGEHSAFGSLTAGTETIFPETIPDTKIGASAKKLRQLSQLAGAAFVSTTDASETRRVVQEFVSRNTEHSGVALPSRFKMGWDFFWILKTPWIWLLLLCLPCEVMVRRWHNLMRPFTARAAKAPTQT